ncbi:hypothetical protein PVAP13_8KG149901 [Panicum virgatum]|uniref:Uncharacterized protein n=1 Tax=Panicum virgatum TaxID=38727 RepID=A0A8T0PI61_PANVG|nr:hypothetical protein PVAP13_8KG149901 [Panicum virgatum]
MGSRDGVEERYMVLVRAPRAVALHPSCPAFATGLRRRPATALTAIAALLGPLSPQNLVLSCRGRHCRATPRPRWEKEATPLPLRASLPARVGQPTPPTPAGGIRPSRAGDGAEGAGESAEEEHEGERGRGSRAGDSPPQHLPPPPSRHPPPPRAELLNDARGQRRHGGAKGGREVRASSSGMPWRREGGAAMTEGGATAVKGGAAAAEKWRWRRERSGERREGREVQRLNRGGDRRERERTDIWGRSPRQRNHRKTS